MSIKVTWRRKDQLFAKLKRVAPEATAALAVANGEAAREMADLARGFAPVKTGRLRESIVVTPPGAVPPAHAQGAGTVPPGAYMVTAGNERVRYAHLVEFGSAPHTVGGRFEGAAHPGTSARPFFWPAYRLIRRKHRSRGARALGKALRKVAR